MASNTTNNIEKLNKKKLYHIRTLESILENETPKILRGFEIQTDHLILTRKRDLINKKKKTCNIGDIAVKVDH